MDKINQDILNNIKIAKQLMEFAYGKETFFSPTRKLFTIYWKNLQETKKEKLTKNINDLSCEALTRFAQLDYLLSKIKNIEKELEVKRQGRIDNTPIHIQWMENLKASNEDYEKFPLTEDIINSLTDDEGHQLITELQLFTESFYYMSHRLKKIIEYYPGLEEFKPVGVINVRNNLIEHPHGKNGVTLPSFATGGLYGPVIKAGRTEDQMNISVDVGLYKNAEEFRDKLNYILHVALKQNEN